MIKKTIIGVIILLACMGAVSAADIDVTTSDTFYFYSLDSLAANDEYYAAISVDGTPYYLDYDDYDKLAEFSNSFAIGFINQFQDTSTVQDVKMGGLSVATIETPGYTIGDFEQPVDKEFSFDYKTGTVGLNKNAHIVSKLYL
ncbi:MAG: hypothetical protein IKH29_02505 [Methanobrevibacter sp.]|uniref:hypothetical protein n=1 Tax=Methanobrevibacter sp. TaxID=66852 RepID=UPI0025DBC074|nr:hypothetical protein [Methanobrevibacter sp.]MBR3112569.1 hypothetical protein [Methanobrevibacter sp.]